MYHSITFGDKNTWDDWHLVPASRPTFSMPPLQERYVDIPGLNGPVDLTEAITGYPVYGNRTGSFEFIVMNDWYDSDGTLTRGKWQERYSEIANYLHGRSMKAWLEDDPEYYYEGRFKLAEWRSEKDYSRISIEYNVGPYKWAEEATDEPWLWDPFSFETGVIGNSEYTDENYYSRDNLVTTVSSQLNFTTEEVGLGTLSARFAVAADEEDPATKVTLTVSDNEGVNFPVDIAVGTERSIPGVKMVDGYWKRGSAWAVIAVVTDTGKATVTTKFRKTFDGYDAFSHISIDTTPIELSFSDSYPDSGTWPTYAAGNAPQAVSMSATGASISITVEENNVVVSTISIPAGSGYISTGLVLYKGSWLYNGRPVQIGASTSSGTGTLALKFRRGSL